MASFGEPSSYQSLFKPFGQLEQMNHWGVFIPALCWKWIVGLALLLHGSPLKSHQGFALSLIHHLWLHHSDLANKMNLPFCHYWWSAEYIKMYPNVIFCAIIKAAHKASTTDSNELGAEETRDGHYWGRRLTSMANLQATVSAPVGAWCTSSQFEWRISALSMFLETKYPLLYAFFHHAKALFPAEELCAPTSPPGLLHQA